MSHLISHGEGGGFDERPLRIGCNDTVIDDYEPQRNHLCHPSRRHNLHQRQGLNEMSLTTSHQTHIHHIFYALCEERRWALGFPTSFDYGYLPEHFTKVQARIVLSDIKPLILIHPAAFNKDNGELVKGLLHHELCHHILGPDVAHGPIFSDYGQAWDGYWLFKSESLDFARWLARQNPKYSLKCASCNTTFMRNTVPNGRIACRPCCIKYANGEYDDNYALHIGGVSMSQA